MKEKLIHCGASPVEYYGYSERGAISLFMFRAMDDINKFNSFLGSIEGRNGEQLFKKPMERAKTVKIFSELEFGKRDGFGCPDGMFAIELMNGKLITIMFEAKQSNYFNECAFDVEGYNSSLRGQIELRWRAVNAFKNSLKEPKIGAFQENGETAAFFKGSITNKEMPGDVYYHKTVKNNRRINDKTVMSIFGEYLDTKRSDIYYLCITAEKDEKNPFLNRKNESLLPRIDPDNNKLCWVDLERVVRFINAEISEDFVWYACYGSNMDGERFKRYILGGVLNDKEYFGCRSKTTRSGQMPEFSKGYLKYNLYFNHKSNAWDNCCVSFVKPNNNEDVITYAAYWKLTRQEFLDVFVQENGYGKGSYLENDSINWKELFKTNETEYKINKEKDGTYGKLLLDHIDTDGIPVITFTVSDKRKATMQKGSESLAYIEHIKKGLKEIHQLTEDEINKYITAASLRSPE